MARVQYLYHILLLLLLLRKLRAALNHRVAPVADLKWGRGFIGRAALDGIVADHEFSAISAFYVSILDLDRDVFSVCDFPDILGKDLWSQFIDGSCRQSLPSLWIKQYTLQIGFRSNCCDFLT